jgi:TRAP-type C4-dicarboxylate transport system permease small subunit
MGRVEIVINAIVRTLLNIAMAALAAMMLLTVADVTGRYLFNRPLTGSTEVTEFMMACLSFLALVWCTLKKTHIKLDLMDRYIRATPQIISDIFFYLLGVGLFSLVSWQNFLLARVHQIGLYDTPVLKLPDYPFYLVVSFACGMVALVLLLSIIQNISQMVKKWT